MPTAVSMRSRHDRNIVRLHGTMVYPTAVVFDDFNTGANQAVSTRSGWGTGHYLAPHVDFKTDAVPTAAKVLPTPAVASSNFWAAIQSADQEAMLSVQTSGGNHWLFCRADTASSTAIGNGYRCYFGFDGALVIAKTVATVSTTLLTILAGTSVPNPAANDTYVFQTIGTLLNAYRRKGGTTTWDMLASASDASVSAAGYIGMGTDGFSDPIIDSFGGISLGTQITNVLRLPVSVRRTGSGA